MNQFHVGQKVVCIETWGPMTGGYGDEVGPVKGEVYTIREIGMAFNVEGIVAVLLAEIHNPSRLYGFLIQHKFEPAFHASLFRPVKTTNIDVFLKMLKPDLVDA